MAGAQERDAHADPLHRPFRGVRVLDLSQEISGPYATKLLADLGATVLKVEDPEAPDPLRRRTASRQDLPDGEDSALFRFLNGGKRGASCGAGQREALLALARNADLLFENGPPGSLERRLASVAELREANPRLSVVSVSPWGRQGPYAERPANEWTLLAATGFTGRRGTPERGPIGAGGRLGDYIAASFAAVGALAALHGARHTGEGRHVDVSMFEGMLLCTTTFADLHSQFVEGLQPQYLDTPAIEPASDGWVGLSAITSQQWQDFCLMIEQPELGLDEKNLSADLRMKNLEFIHGVIHAWTRARSVEEILEQANLLRLPSAPVCDAERLLRVDHFAKRGVFVDNPHGFLQPRSPIHLSSVPDPAPRPAPSLGEHALAWPEEAGNGAPAAPSDATSLEGLRVVDLTAFWAGPFATRVLSQLGADVVKVESIQRPDGMRFVNTKPGCTPWEAGSIFHGTNTGKRGITLRLDAAESQPALRALVERADVLIENFSPRVLEHFDLSWEKLHAWNPRLILVRMPAWGLDGPWRDRTGFAMNVEQACGIAWRAGYADLPLTPNVCDPIGSLHTVTALLAALAQREQTGEGQQIEVPLVEPGLNLAAEQVLEHSAYGASLTSEGNRGPDAAPQGAYRCQQGEYLVLAVENDDQWRALGSAFPDAGLADPAWNTAAARHTHHDAIDARLAALFAELPVADAEARVLAASVPAQHLVNGHRVSPHPQLTDRGFFAEIDHVETGRSRYPGLPYVGVAGDGPSTPPPTLGEHNREVLEGELGFDRETVDTWEEAGLIGRKPAWV